MPGRDPNGTEGVEYFVGELAVVKYAERWITERDSVTTEVSAHTTQQPVIRIKSQKKRQRDAYHINILTDESVARRHIITGPADGNASELAESIDTMSATRRARNALQTAGYYPDLGEFWVVHCVIGRTG
ncbi:hypothetical protein C6341_g19291 [Phytophthora cactorum]|uniref:Uncharacterized protein n=1 Tax=Phytophthora cactorum TaxID=29920 RepID=A0A8T1CN69_9STRA|nr:hypothetical protein PC117_g15331 [Phytophthora cactorum]KAG3007084.1 hypothetical protein PC120_g17007 [Phytophthora cactorum]KAG3142835.1 hypothetical protein C6341_g19291 [Phytophthora cactorum]